MEVMFSIRCFYFAVVVFERFYCSEWYGWCSGLCQLYVEATVSEVRCLVFECFYFAVFVFERFYFAMMVWWCSDLCKLYVWGL